MTNKVSRIAIICALEETIRDEVKRMCDTDALAEVDTMALHAKENIENLRSVKYKILVKESTEVVKDLVEADRKTENCSEKPNNCKKCKWWNESYGCHWKEGVCHYVPKAIIPKQCVSCDSASRIIEAYSQGFKDGADAVKAMPQTFTADGIVFAKMEEPQTDCSWK